MAELVSLCLAHGFIRTAKLLSLRPVFTWNDAIALFVAAVAWSLLYKGMGFLITRYSSEQEDNSSEIPAKWRNIFNVSALAVTIAYFAGLLNDKPPLAGRFTHTYLERLGNGIPACFPGNQKWLQDFPAFAAKVRAAHPGVYHAVYTDDFGKKYPLEIYDRPTEGFFLVRRFRGRQYGMSTTQEVSTSIMVDRNFDGIPDGVHAFTGGALTPETLRLFPYKDIAVGDSHAWKILLAKLIEDR